MTSFNPRENLLKLYRRQGYDRAPVGMHFCPSLVEEFRRRYPDFKGDYLDFFEAPYRIIYDPGFAWNFDEVWRIPGRDKMDWHRFYPAGFQYKVKFDGWGTAHEDNPDSKHMTRMHHPLRSATSVADLEAYPWPEFEKIDYSYLKPQVDAIHARNLAVFVWAECTIWETAWYLRCMEELFVDMGTDDPMATYLLDKITNLACFRAAKFAAAGVDILGLGDDIGMQNTIMMSEDMYRTWLKPRLTKVIAAAKAVKPDILISYHSCGYVLPFIPDLIEAGVDILNPVQPECMDFADVHAKYGDRISFNGTLGTQQLMPFGTPEQVKAEVRRNLGIAGKKGGLFCCPTHMLEPEVPWANIEAYVEASRETSS
ncbi:MAG: uroporphyrinogen decarboxylase family protein [bacterium]